MNQVEVKSKQIQSIVSVLGAVTWLILGRMIGDNGIAYFAAATEGFLIFYCILSGRVSEALGRVLRSRCQKGQFKNADKVKSSVLLFQSVVGVLGGVLLFFLAPVLAEKVFLIPYGTLALRILAPALTVRILIQILLGYFQGTGTQMPNVAVHLLRYLFSLGFAFVFVRLLREYGEKVKPLLLNEDLPAMYGAAGMAVAVAVSELLLLLFVVFLYIFSRKTQRNREEGLKKTETFSGAIGSLYSAMLPWSLVDLLTRLPLWIGMVFFLRNMEDLQTAVIHYGKYYGKYLVVCIIPILICESLLHSLAAKTARAVRKGEQRYAKDIFGAGFHTAIVITLFPTVFLSVLSTQVGHLVEETKGVVGELGKMFLMGSSLILLAVISQFLIRCALYMGKWKPVMGSLGLYVIVFVGSAFACFRLRKLGIEGLIYAGLAALFVLCLSVGIFLFRMLRAKFDLLYWVGIPAVAAVASGLICYLLGKYLTPHMGYLFTVSLGLVTGFVVYWILLIVLKCFGRRELEVIPGGKLIGRLSEFSPW